MAAPGNGREFLDLLEQSQILEAEFLQGVRMQVQRHLESDARRLAKTLINNRVITEYQARQLLAGRYKGFYIGKYKILEQIGAGGMGRVYLAEQITMERLVAVKVMSKISRKDRQKEALARFTREARAVAALRHNNIIHAYDFDQEHGAPYMVMEFIEGVDTARLAGKYGKIPWPQAAEYIRQAAAGLQHAHQAGLVHRDIKPGNLLLDVHGTIKILDLGLCSIQESTAEHALTIDQNQLGTVDFVAPEQVMDSHNVDGRADIYGLGATFYGILAGQVLYPGRTAAQKLLLHQTTAPQPIEELVPDLPRGLGDIVRKMLAKRPEDRFQTSQELESVLVPFASPANTPYDLSILKYRRSEFEPFLGNSPDPTDISVQPLKGASASDAVQTPVDAATVEPTTAASQIGMADSFSNLEQFTYNNDDYTELSLPEPARKKRKGTGKAKKGKSKGSAAVNQPFLLGASALLVFLLAVLLFSTIFFSAPVDSTEQSPLPAVDTSLPQRPKTFTDWQEHSRILRSDPSILGYYTFERDDLEGTILRNAADSKNLGPLDLSQAPWGRGRWSQKGALDLHGIASGEHAALSTSDSAQLHMQGPTSIAVSFKVDKFETAWQAIVTKGDHSWRIQRNNNDSNIVFSITRPQDDGRHASDVSAHTSTTRSRTNVNDGRWHQVVGVFRPKGPAWQLTLYVDGRKEDETDAPLPDITEDPVWIGANGEQSMRNKNADQKISGGIRTFDGQIDEVIFWNRALNDAEVQALYQAPNL